MRQAKRKERCTHHYQHALAAQNRVHFRSKAHGVDVVLLTQGVQLDCRLCKLGTILGRPIGDTNGDESACLQTEGRIDIDATSERAGTRSSQFKPR
jgi:hypothetical protein